MKGLMNFVPTATDMSVSKDEKLMIGSLFPNLNISRRECKIRLDSS
jgi:hypothetical protein